MSSNNNNTKEEKKSKNNNNKSNSKNKTVLADKNDSGSKYLESRNKVRLTKNTKLNNYNKKTSTTPSAKKYLRGNFVAPTNIRNPVLAKRLEHNDVKKKQASEMNLRSELMMSQQGSGFIEADKGEHTYQYKQHEIAENVDLQTSAKMFELVLKPNGPYHFDFTRNGKHILLAGANGHVSSMEWKKGKKYFESHFKDIIRDACFLHNETMFALAQKNFVYIYDNQGTQLHQLKSHQDPGHLTFLPYHYLLLSTSANVFNNFLTYEDVSIGNVVAKHKMDNLTTALTVNISNGIVHAGDTAGHVSLWTPNHDRPVVKILAHSGNVTGVASSLSGNYMVTSGYEGVVKVFDLRNSFQELHAYRVKGRPSSLSLSDTNVLAVSAGTHTVLWKNPFDTSITEPYLVQRHYDNANATRIRFCPFEDILGVGHDYGYSSWVVPGAGTPNFDTREADIYETVKSRQEREVRTLLEKIPHDMIHINADFVGRVTADSSVQTDEMKFKREIKAQPDPKRIKVDRVKRDQQSQERKLLKDQRNQEILNPTHTRDALSRFNKK